jgi:hypothetical protein
MGPSGVSHGIPCSGGLSRDARLYQRGRRASSAVQVTARWRSLWVGGDGIRNRVAREGGRSSLASVPPGQRVDDCDWQTHLFPLPRTAYARKVPQGQRTRTCER